MGASENASDQKGTYTEGWQCCATGISKQERKTLKTLYKNEWISTVVCGLTNVEKQIS